jgi:hypothetical protein
MRLDIEADSADELRAKAPELLARLAKALGPHIPELADVLEKATLPPREPELKHEALRDLFQVDHTRYLAMLDRMLADIGAALDEHVDLMAKSESPDFTTGIVSIDTAAYNKVKEQLALYGMSESDFTDPSGKLYGASTNELRDILKQLQSQKTG